jgi:hypothetical protein
MRRIDTYREPIIEETDQQAGNEPMIPISKEPSARRNRIMTADE